MTPRYFIHCFRSNAWEEPSLLLMLRLILISFFYRFNYHEVCFAILIDNLLTSHHFLTLANSEFSTFSSDFRSLTEAKTLASSAKILKHNFSKQFGKSFMYIKNKRGPNVLRCWMPQGLILSKGYDFHFVLHDCANRQNNVNGQLHHCTCMYFYLYIHSVFPLYTPLK